MTWRYEGLVWRPTAGSWNEGGLYWAPDIERGADGSYLLYYTAQERIGVARASSPTGPFTDLLAHPLIGGGYGGIGDGVTDRTGVGWLDQTLNVDDIAIDAEVLTARDGSRYLYVSAAPGGGPTTIVGVRLVDDAVLAPEPPTKVLSIDVVSWEGLIREAAIVEQRADGKFVLTYSGSKYLDTCYAVGEAVADGPLGPFTRVGSGPFLHDDPTIGVYGPGHHSFTVGPGGERIIFFHTQTTYDRDLGRTVRWAPFTEAANGSYHLVDPPGTVGNGRSSCWPFPING